MQWRGNRESSNVDDQRSSTGRRTIIGGGIGTVILAIIIFLLGGNPTPLLTEQIQSDQDVIQQPMDPSDSSAQFVSVILASTEDVWTSLFAKNNLTYVKPTLVLFSGRTFSSCGGASAESGPFYCPADQKVYLDMSFFRDMSTQLGSHGQFANAYVIAHEIGHHVQNLMGISTKISNLQAQSSQKVANEWSVKLELQADFFAGIWAHYANNLKLTEDDIKSALSAANAVGDDRIMKETQGYIVPDGFTHGTSEQRMTWFTRGYQTGDLNQGDTYSDPNL